MDKEIWLVICGAGPEAGVFRIEQGCHIIGRSAGCDIHLSHSSVSRRHAILVNEDGKLSIRDLGSQNGTFVDGKPVQFARVPVGSSLRLGRVTLDVVQNLPDRPPCVDDEEATPSSRINEPADGVFLASRFPPARKRVLLLLLEGLAEKQTAKRLDRTEHTVHWHLKAIYKELGVHSRAALCALFRKTESIPAEPEAIAADSQNPNRK